MKELNINELKKRARLTVIHSIKINGIEHSLYGIPVTFKVE